MSEIINDKKVFSLHELTTSIQRVIAERANQSYWVKAEMNKLNLYKHSGHCYPELVEKRDGVIVAEMRAILWRTDYQRINEQFMSLLKQPLQDGITILFCARVKFDPVRGLNLHISDIDPVFSLGELEKERQACISRLKAEGLFDRNKKLSFPLLPQRIAIISVETSKGYADFMKVTGQNEWGYAFFQMLFPALLQGDRSVPSIIAQLENIRKVQHHFDVVAIIRGGGGEVGLTSYDNYELCKAIATFPLPVLTGIGHATNLTVSEMVSHRNAITPSELAMFLLQHFHDFAVPVQRGQEKIVAHARQLLQEENNAFRHLVRIMRSVTENHLLQHKNDLQQYSQDVVREARYLLRRSREQQELIRQVISKRAVVVLQQQKQELSRQAVLLDKETQLLLRNIKSKLETTENTVRLLSPQNILKRGYSIAFFEGKALRSTANLKPGDEIITMLEDGSVTSKIIRTDNDNEHD